MRPPPVATTVDTDPTQIPAPGATANVLAPILGLDAGDLTERLEGETGFVYLARQIDPEVAEAVADRRLAGVHLMDEPARVNPADGLASGLLGLVDGDHVGGSGREAHYEDRLRGRPGELVVERDLEGHTIASGERRHAPAVQGEDLALTIDRGLQHVAEQALSDQLAAVGARGAMAVVSAPTTGEILALANETADAGSSPGVPPENQAAATDFEP